MSRLSLKLKKKSRGRSRKSRETRETGGPFGGKSVKKGAAMSEGVSPYAWHIYCSIF
jgi:hypothetical protein